MQFNEFYGEKKIKTECPDSHILYIIIKIYFYKQEFKPFSESHNNMTTGLRGLKWPNKSATFSPQLLFVVNPYFRKAEPFKSSI